MKPTLLILAAGMGSRYGGLKQLDPVGPNGELIIAYSIYDAIRAGFGKIVFVIRHQFEDAFKEKFGAFYEKHTTIDYAYQEMDSCIGDFQIPTDREKPWGTGHAILVAKDVIDEPFAVINADDFYGSRTLELMAEFLTTKEDSSNDYCMAGFQLKNTLSEYGTVSRGISQVDEEMFLTNVTEHANIERRNDTIISFDEQGNKHNLTGDEIVSMNLWGLKSSIFEFLKKQFAYFLKRYGSKLKSEFYIPTAVDQLIQKEKILVKVLPTKEKWFGVTYREDMKRARNTVGKLIDQGVYPERLWQR